MSTARVDSPPFLRLRRVARFLSVNGIELGDDDIHAALRRARGDTSEAEALLRQVAAHWHILPSSRASLHLTREERIRKAAHSLAPHCDAVDILHGSLSKVKAAPHNERFRKVNVQAPGPFKERVACKPGGVELLYSVGYEPMHGHLVLQTLNMSLIDCALAALAAVKQGDQSYLEARALKTTALEAEAARVKQEAAANAQRALSLAKVPVEPSVENGGSSTSTCVLTFAVDGKTVARRKFESDNTLSDVVNYIKSLPAVPIKAPLKVENVTTYPRRTLNPETQGMASLYALDLWPISTVAVEVLPEPAKA